MDKPKLRLVIKTPQKKAIPNVEGENYAFRQKN
jgi:hypothetical protein